MNKKIKKLSLSIFNINLDNFIFHILNLIINLFKKTFFIYIKWKINKYK